MRYFFDLTDGDTCTDLGGAEFPSEEAARQEAILRSVDGSHDFALRSYGNYRYIRLRDDTGRTVCKVRIDESNPDAHRVTSHRSSDDS
jgi:hypothetical protein